MESDISTINPMNISILKKAGLTESQAKGYLALIEHGSLSPARLAKITGETRTNGYMICDKLEKLGLATKKPGNKTTYDANHPATIEQLAERRRKTLLKNEQEIKRNLGPLVDFYYSRRDTPGVTTYSGKDGIAQLYDIVIHDKNDVEFLRSPHDSDLMGKEFYPKFLEKRAKAGIRTRAINIDTPSEREFSKHDSERKIIEHSWLKPKDYSAKVEWSVFGNKVTAITFGEEPIALTIHSKHIAESIRQIFRIIRKSASR